MTRFGDVRTVATPTHVIGEPHESEVRSGSALEVCRCQVALGPADEVTATKGAPLAPLPASTHREAVAHDSALGVKVRGSPFVAGFAVNLPEPDGAHDAWTAPSLRLLISRQPPPERHANEPPNGPEATTQERPPSAVSSVNWP